MLIYRARGETHPGPSDANCIYADYAALHKRNAILRIVDFPFVRAPFRHVPGDPDSDNACTLLVKRILRSVSNFRVLSLESKVLSKEKSKSVVTSNFYLIGDFSRMV